MPRKLSQFACHRLKDYSYRRPRLSSLSYQLPLPFPAKIEFGSPAHVGPHSGALDFLVPSKTPVLAAAPGQVIELIDDYSIPFFLRLQGSYWPTRPWRGRMNYVALEHQQGKIIEYTFYGHLQKNSSQVKLGQTVKAGQTLALTGWSGWMNKPHLHFVVYTKDVLDYPEETHESLRPRWQNQS